MFSDSIKMGPENFQRLRLRSSVALVNDFTDSVLRYLRWALAKPVIAAIVFSTLPFLGMASAEPGTNVTVYNVTGVFKESQSAGRVAVISHEKIPHYMDAMTMPFNVKKPSEIKALKPGDQISFQLFVTDTDDWIADIKKLGKRSKVLVQAETRAFKEIGPGALLPDCILTNQAGQSFRTSDLKGKALALTFFFSRCPLPSFCPRMNNNFSAVQKALQPDASGTNWQLLSISFDPGFDTPERLSDFAVLHQANPQHWIFATSSSDEIRRFGGAFGLQFWRENGTFSHNLRTVVVNSSGRVQKVFNGNEWESSELVNELRQAMASSP